MRRGPRRRERRRDRSRSRRCGRHYAALKAAVISYFGVGSPQLVKFGLKPRKARPRPSPPRKLLAVRAAKVKATRQLRGTKGPVQKAAIKAGPMQISIGPVAASAAVSSAQPAQASSAASTSPPDVTLGEASPAAGK